MIHVHQRITRCQRREEVFCGTFPFLRNASKEDDGGGDEDVVGRGMRVVGGGE